MKLYISEENLGNEATQEQAEQGQQLALDTGKITFGSFPALNCGVTD